MAVSLITFMERFGGAMLGMALSSILPQYHLDADSRDVLRLSNPQPLRHVTTRAKSW
jgi:hypothetical protein